MLRHVVLLDWTPDVTEEQKYNLTEALDRLPTLIPTIRDYRFGPDAGINKGTFDFALVADFDDADGYRAYSDHPVHRDIVERFIDPIAAQRASVQYEF
jgi:hypothetical protein